MANDISNEKRTGKGHEFILREIAGAVASMKYGDIVIKIHDSKIIQVAKTEKTRYDNYRGMEQGCGI